MVKRKKMKAQGWTPIYMVIVIIIAIILLLTFVKPLFQQASGVANQNLQTAAQVTKSIAISLFH